MSRGNYEQAEFDLTKISFSKSQKHAWNIYTRLKSDHNKGLANSTAIAIAIAIAVAWQPYQFETLTHNLWWRHHESRLIWRIYWAFNTYRLTNFGQLREFWYEHSRLAGNRGAKAYLWIAFGTIEKRHLQVLQSAHQRRRIKRDATVIRMLSQCASAVL